MPEQSPSTSNQSSLPVAKSKAKQWNAVLTTEELQSLSAPKLQKEDPQRYKGILKALALGLPAKTIASLFNVSEHTVANIVCDNPQKAGDWKQVSKRQWAKLSYLANERLLENIDSMDLRSLSFFAGLAADKLSVANDSPSQIVEKQSQSIDPNTLLDGLKDAEVVDVEDISQSD